MREFEGDVWEYPADAYVITTNGTVKANGTCVMGRGVAKQARGMFPGIDLRLGTFIKRFGNHVHSFEVSNVEGVVRNIHRSVSLLSFPVKHHWDQKADLKLIERSAIELSYRIMMQFQGSMTVAMVRPGCGNGQRSWNVVKPIIEPYLDDRFVIVEKHGG